MSHSCRACDSPDNHGKQKWDTFPTNPSYLSCFFLRTSFLCSQKLGEEGIYTNNSLAIYFNDSVCHLMTIKPMCLSQGFYFCTKHHNQEASWGGKDVFSLHFHIVVHHQRKSGLKQDRKQELMQKPWRDVTYCLASPGLLSLLFYRTKDYHPRHGTTHNGLGPSTLDH